MGNSFESYFYFFLTLQKMTISFFDRLTILM